MSSSFNDSIVPRGGAQAFNYEPLKDPSNQNSGITLGTKASDTVNCSLLDVPNKIGSHEMKWVSHSLPQELEEKG